VTASNNDEYGILRLRLDLFVIALERDLERKIKLSAQRNISLKNCLQKLSSELAGTMIKNSSLRTIISMSAYID
jgi:hypothetical protein